VPSGPDLRKALARRCSNLLRGRTAFGVSAATLRPERGTLTGPPSQARANARAASRARLTDANLTLSRAYLFSANLTGATFEPSSVEGLRRMEFTTGLSTLRFADFPGPTALVLMRDDFRKRGLHAQARELTYAIRRQERKLRGDGG
jgi:hypothetical protein